MCFGRDYFLTQWKPLMDILHLGYTEGYVDVLLNKIILWPHSAATGLRQIDTSRGTKIDYRSIVAVQIIYEFA